MLHQALFFDGWGLAPAYYQVDVVEGEIPEQALSDNRSKIVASIRHIFGLSVEDISDEEIYETIYLLREGGLVSAAE